MRSLTGSIGIVVLIVGSHFPLLHFGFHCYPTLRTVYLSHVSFWGAIAFYIVTQPKYAQPQHKGTRTLVFVALGLSGIAPLLHGLWIAKSWHFVTEVLGAKYVMLSGATYIFGACLYVAHIPERWCPRTFDLLGASHQLFHVCVLLGAWLHWVAVHHAYTFWHAVETVGGARGQEAVCAVLRAS